MACIETRLQTTFKTLQHKTIVNLIYTANWLQSKHATLVRSYGISMQQFNILRILKGQQDTAMCIGSIKERMLDRESDVSRLIDALHKKGLITREICADDRRKSQLFISEAGKDLLLKLNEEVSALDSMLDNLNTEQQQLLNTLLDTLRGPSNASDTAL